MRLVCSWFQPHKSKSELHGCHFQGQKHPTRRYFQLEIRGNPELFLSRSSLVLLWWFVFKADTENIMLSTFIYYNSQWTLSFNIFRYEFNITGVHNDMHIQISWAAAWQAHNGRDVTCHCKGGAAQRRVRATGDVEVDGSWQRRASREGRAQKTGHEGREPSCLFIVHVSQNQWN